MYKNNSRGRGEFKEYSPLQLSYNLISKKPVVGYYSYTKRTLHKNGSVW